MSGYCCLSSRGIPEVCVDVVEVQAVGGALGSYFARRLAVLVEVPSPESVSVELPQDRVPLVVQVLQPVRIHVDLKPYLLHVPQQVVAVHVRQRKPLRIVDIQLQVVDNALQKRFQLLD